MKHLYVPAIAASLLIALPAFAQTTPEKAKPTQQSMQTVQRQHTDGEDVTGNNNFPAASSGVTKQRTDGEDVTGNNNFPASSK